MDRLEKQMSFILELDKSKFVKRQTYLSDANTREDDAQHSWHLAVMCMLLSEYSNEPIDVLKTMSMVIIHDVIEIDAGDTYAYDEKGNASKKERELKAANRLFNILPEDQALYVRGLWDEFEEGKTPESRFANAMDKIQPILLNDASGGKAWVNHKVCEDQIYGRNVNTPLGSERLWEYAKSIISENVNKGNIKESK